MDGDWDRRSCDEIPSHGGPPMDLYHAEQIEQGRLYRAIESHFVDGVPWEDTEFVRRAIEYLNDGVEWVWHDCSSRRDVMDRCRWLDELHRSMRRHGCLSYPELTSATERENGFLYHMQNEIVVDVGRTGELLLVSGKHRYSLARAIGLDEIPVTFLVRHEEWMETRRAVARNDDRDTSATTEDHPDLRDINENGPECDWRQWPLS